MTSACGQSEKEFDPQKSFSVMSYNLRFANPSDGSNSWDKRKERVTNLINFYEPGLVGTQEGLLHQLKFISRELPYYQWIGKGRDNGTMEGEFSALFYDTRRFELIENSEETFWLSKTPSKPSKGWDADFPRIVTVGIFKDKRTKRQFVVLNTHFDHVGDTARLESAKLIVDTIRRNYSTMPVILTGDFNATPGSKPYKVITGKNTVLRDAYHTSQTANVGPSFTFEGFTVQSESQKRRIDYIFTNDRFEVKKHAIISSFNQFRYPSDHLPVIATLQLK
jgi:endonuclease/exonuclease/phosphatase family metal-dependent hydrolase